MSELQHQRDPRPWRNLRAPQPLPPPDPDHFQWRPGEIVFGRPRQRMQDAWIPPVQAEPRHEAANG
jgi:hypothetical protein